MLFKIVHLPSVPAFYPLPIPCNRFTLRGGCDSDEFKSKFVCPLMNLLFNCTLRIFNFSLRIGEGFEFSSASPYIRPPLRLRFIFNFFTQSSSLQQRRKVFAWAFFQLEHENHQVTNAITYLPCIIKKLKRSAWIGSEDIDVPTQFFKLLKCHDDALVGNMTLHLSKENIFPRFVSRRQRF